MLQILRTATIMLGLLTVLTGLAYPFAVTAVAQIGFPKAANGSLFEKPRGAANTPAHGNARDWRADHTHTHQNGLVQN